MASPGNYFFNPDFQLMRSPNTIGAGYLCMDSKASNCEAMEDGFYLNSLSTVRNYVISYDATNTATASQNIFIDTQNQFFVNSGVERENKMVGATYPLIRCDSKICRALPFENTPKGFYMNSGDTTKTTLIECDKTDCYVVATPNFGYYINADDEDPQRPVFLCNESQGTCDYQSLSSLDPGYYINAGSEEKNSIIHCDGTFCTALTLSNNLSQGYYINAGDSSAPIITCTQSTCTAGPDQGTKFKGSYQFIDNSFKFIYVDNDSIGCNSDKVSESLFYVMALGADEFPGLLSNVQTLFKISKSSITQVVMDGVLPIGKSDLKIKNGPQVVDNTIDLYYCSKSTELCSVRTSCVEGTFLLNPLSHTAFYCSSDNQLVEVTETDGYYIDGGRSDTTPYLISCYNGYCQYITAPLNYYINAGAQFNSKASLLIYCTQNYCQEVPSVTSGYYLASDTDGDIHIHRGVIHCTSSTECVEIKGSVSPKYFINSGADKLSKALIRCQHYRCSTLHANAGYYLFYEGSQLIYCIDSINCSLVPASAGYYYLSDTEDTQSIISCTPRVDSTTNLLESLNCELEKGSPGYYIAAQSGILIDCMSTANQCSPMVIKDGVYRSASTSYTSYTRYVDVNERSLMGREDQALTETGSMVNSIQRANNNMVYNIIICESGHCHELTPSELYDIPYCSFTNNKCFVNNDPVINGKIVQHVSAGDFCTNEDRSVFYFAIDSIDLETDTIDVTLSTYTYTTTTTNCIMVSNAYANNYFTVGNQIFKIGEGSIMKMTTPGYYFIDVEKNTLLMSRTNEKLYNQETAKLYRCTGERCHIVEKPEGMAYYADVNKHIIQYDPKKDTYSFPYNKDIICIYNDRRQCIPKYDLNTNEFCITYKGELALVDKPIVAFETGGCYKSVDVNTKVYGLSNYFYEMDAFSATRIVTSGFYLIDSTTNGSINYKTLSKSASSKLLLYGCLNQECKFYTPEENSYYYDELSHRVLKYEGGVWHTSEKQGYAFIKINPSVTHIYRVKNSLNQDTLEIVNDSGYYYTIDMDMYDCNYNTDIKNLTCLPISNSDYYYTNDRQIYYCVYDSENLEKTLCTQQLCIGGQNYYFHKKYYRCNQHSSTYDPVNANSCHPSDTVVINYPTFLKEEFPPRVQTMLQYMYEVNISDIETHYNSSYIPSITGVFDSCQYDPVTDLPSYNLVCLKNFVLLSSVQPPKICSIRRMGYVECVEDEEHPGRCHPDSARSLLHALKSSSNKFILTFIILLTTILPILYDHFL